MAYLQSSAYCPTQRAYAMTLTNTAYQTSVAAGASGYQSLYSEERRDLDLLDVRKDTFIFYPKSSIATQDMAAAGFYYTGEAYVVKCFCCKLTVTRFNSRDRPIAVHRSRAPDCPFVRKTVTQGGVPEVEPQPDREEDMVDGFSLDSDVEDDGPSQDQLVPRGLPMKDVAMTAKAAKPLRPAAPTSKAELKKENERLRSEITCRKCKRTRVQTLFLPCRHLVACEECANSMDDCITCSEKILGTVRTFLI